jgi:bifunctional non-homologous end joining protein LigD
LRGFAVAVRVFNRAESATLPTHVGLPRNAFDVLALNGDDLRSLPLSMRKARLSRLLARRPDGIFISPFEQGEIGPDLFRAACNMGLEGLVSKRRDRPYRGGRSKDWVKVKNRKHPALERVKDAFS